MIETRDLRKYYVNDTVKAVDGVSFTCPDGQITGLLGPNGAGKSTALRMIAGLIRPLSGTAIVDGADVTVDANRVRALLGVQSDMTGIYPRMTPRQQLRYYGAFYNLKGQALDDRVSTVIKLLGMEEIADRIAEGFSRGQRQKVVIGRALVHDPRSIIMDEPTNGIDVMAARETRDVIAEFRAQGRCVLFSTHYMDEAERLCDRIAIIVAGRIRAFGTPGELMAQTGHDNLEDAFVALAGAGVDLRRGDREIAQEDRYVGAHR